MVGWPGNRPIPPERADEETINRAAGRIGKAMFDTMKETGLRQDDQVKASIRALVVINGILGIGEGRS